ncbi:MAG: LA_2272 family surface repeat-containing protein [Oligosphaeraceae bacterium]
MFKRLLVLTVALAAATTTLLAQEAPKPQLTTCPGKPACSRQLVCPMKLNCPKAACNREDAPNYVLGLGLFQPLQIPFECVDVNGLCVGVFASRHCDVNGLSLALGTALTNHNFNGLAIAGLANWTGYHANGVQIAGLGNYVNGNFRGLQLSLVANVNECPKSTYGAQIALFNRNGGVSAGAQLGAVNLANQLVGTQIGIVNVAQDLIGIQLGLVNVNVASPLPFMVLANARF